jgi:hypothetical protein
VACHLSRILCRDSAFPILTGRDFNDLDGQSKDKDPVVIISETLAQRMFPNQDAINRHVYWTDPGAEIRPGD